MPLTVAHAAAAWPISRRLPRLPLAALVIGTMAPDFEYLAYVQPRGHYGHGLAGLFLLCLPASLGAWVLFERLAKPALVLLLPHGVRAMVSRPGSGYRVETYLWAAAAAVVGAVSHIAWDAFTHERGLAEAGIAALRAPIAPAALGSLRWYQLLQHLSTVVGLGILLLWAWTRWRRFPLPVRRFTHDEAVRAQRFSLLVGCATAVAALLNGARALDRGARIVLGFAAVGAMDALIIAILGYAIAVRFASRPGAARGASTQDPPKQAQSRPP